MILSYQTIKQYCMTEKMIDPWCERTVFKGMSYGLGPCTYDFRVDKILSDTGEVVKEYLMMPMQTLLISTIEKVNLPHNICASVLDKSTMARLFISAFNTHFDPGFVGYPTIELVNNGGHAIRLEHGMPICQFKFEFLDWATEMPYKGKYQNQENKPIEAKNETMP